MEVENKDYLKYRTLCAIPEDALEVSHLDDEFLTELIESYFEQEMQKYEENKREYEEWLYKEIERGSAEAEYKLSQNFYYSGKKKERIEWLTKAAEHGHINAQFELGEHYHENNVKEDNQLALKWYKMAAEQGHNLAQYYAAGILLDNSKEERKLFVNKQEEQLVLQAYDYYKLSIKNRYLPAEYKLNNMLKDKRIRNILKKNDRLDNLKVKK